MGSGSVGTRDVVESGVGESTVRGRGSGKRRAARAAAEDEAARLRIIEAAKRMREELEAAQASLETLIARLSSGSSIDGACAGNPPVATGDDAEACCGRPQNVSDGAGSAGPADHAWQVDLEDGAHHVDVEMTAAGVRVVTVDGDIADRTARLGRGESTFAFELAGHAALITIYARYGRPAHGSALQIDGVAIAPSVR